MRALAIILVSSLLPACGTHRPEGTPIEGTPIAGNPTEGKPAEGKPTEGNSMEQPTDKAAVTLELATGAPVDNRFGLVVPELQLTLRNDTSAELDIPEAGISMKLSLRTKLARGAETIERSAGTGKPVTPKMRKLAAGQSVRVKVSPLDDGPGESPLAEGTWTATVCLGDRCSNAVTLEVAKR